ncbi:putative Cilia- and flagella-associated protein 91 [Blattamonas nauphoetae]|uniref:Cilia- and flagella-associated protein 91 n=1 Tax=Blattamonas nauphoetae TaxID=2049346 RepID=A0ABQ9YCL8_9EUKA|nr:putative Cilia- and flagella-associated protein 91 [Blattamonas nauphoetae]
MQTRAQHGTRTETVTLAPGMGGYTNPGGGGMAALQHSLFRHPHLTFNGTMNSAGSNFNDTVQPRVGTRTIATQSDYRESETQTDPYTPPYVVPEGQSQPDILALLPFTYGHGLPAGAHEIAMIEKAQQRHQQEELLPPVSDPKSSKLRVAFLSQCELEDWMEREEEVRRVQDQRVETLKTILRERDTANDQKRSRRLQTMRERRMAEVSEKSDEVERKRIKTLRHHAEDIRHPEGRRRGKRDIVEEYYNTNSKIYAPLTRDGQVSAHAERFIVKNRYIDTLEGLEVLERDLDSSILGKHARLPKGRKARTQTERNKLKVKDHVKEMERMMGDQKGGEQKKEKREGARREKHIPVRPATPTIDGEEDKDRFEGALLLQRLVRGRAVQLMMMEGREKRDDLIRELRMEERIADMEEHGEDVDEMKALVAQHIVNGAVGQIVSSTFDTLAKELVRVREERRISAMVQLAERNRRLREAAESGRRQEEEERRAREDERMRQVMHTQHRTVDNYLEAIIADSCDAAAKKHAVLEARVLAGRLGDVLSEVENRQPDAVVKDLVSSFLFPEVDRGILREQIKRDQRRFHETAKKNLLDAVNETEEELEGKQEQ